jgi:hypothetical protein
MLAPRDRRGGGGGGGAIDDVVEVEGSRLRKERRERRLMEAEDGVRAGGGRGLEDCFGFWIGAVIGVTGDTVGSGTVDENWVAEGVGKS